MHSIDWQVSTYGRYTEYNDQTGEVSYTKRTVSSRLAREIMQIGSLTQAVDEAAAAAARKDPVKTTE